MSQTASPSTGRSYGVARVCRAWDLARSTRYAHRARATAAPRPPRKRGPHTAWPDDRLTDAIRGVLERSPFIGEGHRKVWARLRMAGVRTSRARTLRLMREAHLLAPTRVGNRHGPRAHDGRVTTDRPPTRCGAPTPPPA